MHGIYYKHTPTTHFLLSVSLALYLSIYLSIYISFSPIESFEKKLIMLESITKIPTHALMCGNRCMPNASAILKATFNISVA